MKPKGNVKAIHHSLSLLGILLAFNTTPYAHAMADGIAPPKTYIGVFGGWSSVDKFDVSQFGTAFYKEDVGGPLAVNAFGTTKSRSRWYWGGQIGYRAMEVPLTHLNFNWGLAPAFELEALYLQRKTAQSEDINNQTARLNEHDFITSFSMTTSVFLTNFVLNFNLPCHNPLHPYVGFGIGGALLKASGSAVQMAPPEPGINHFNSDSNDRVSAFAGQIKAGLSYEWNENWGIFAEYRYLYVASTKLLFGSTVYPGHPETSPWQVKLDQHHYNMVNIGLHFGLC